MNYVNPESLVSTEWLAQHLGAPDIRVVDASWYMPAAKRNPRAEYMSAHIPGAVFFDIDGICDPKSSLPHMLPSPELFSSRVRKLGLGDGTRIVVYDGSTSFVASARVWWMMRYFGHEDVALLDGGFLKWQAEGRPIEDLPPVPRERHFTPRVNTMLLRDFDQMRATMTNRNEQIVDARSAGRFHGQEPEPRAGLRGGHIPGSLNLPYTDLIDSKTGCMLPADTLKARFADHKVALDRPIATSCGSGVSACVIAFALHLIGHRQVAVYDGSWTEWGGRPDAPVEVN